MATKTSNKREPEGRPPQTITKTTATIMFPCSVEFKTALDRFAGNLNQSRAEVIRRLVAEGIGYDLSAEIKRPRSNTKYASPEERKAAMLARAKARRQITRKLLEAYNDKDREVAIAALLQSLKDDPTQTTVFDD